MAFNSLTYFIFLPLVALFYYRLPRRAQNGVLLVASLFFYYASSARLIVVMLAGGLVTFLCARAIGRSSAAAKAACTASGIVLLTVFLCIFKYGGYFAPDRFVWAMPLGMSFYTFTAIGYLADVKNGKIPPETNFFRLLLFLCFFGTIASGPIMRADAFLPQLDQPRTFDTDRTTLALANIGIGLLYKVAISDLLAVYVNAVYADLTAYTGLTLFAAASAFALQLYFDFAGYSLLALGSAQLFGLRVMRNFNAPYFSRSLKEFWARWHISLSSWLRDYIYIPLGGNRKGAACKYRNIILTFLVSGIWHGAGLPFALWGLLHGIGQVVGALFEPVRARIYRALHLSRSGRLASVWQWLCTMLFVNALWVFFRARTIDDALYLLGHQFMGISLRTFTADLSAILLTAFNPKPLLCFAFVGFLLLALALGIGYDIATRFCTIKGDVAAWLVGLPGVRRWLLYYLTAGFIFGGYLLNNGYFATAMNFLYNNF